MSANQAYGTDPSFELNAYSGMPGHDVQGIPDLGIENPGQFLARFRKVEVALSLFGQSGHQVFVVARAQTDRTD